MCCWKENGSVSSRVKLMEREGDGELHTSTKVIMFTGCVYHPVVFQFQCRSVSVTKQSLGGYLIDRTVGHFTAHTFYKTMLK